jgi:hypothetical protein
MTDDRPIGVLVMAYRIADGPDDIERYDTDVRAAARRPLCRGPRVPVRSGGPPGEPSHIRMVTPGM